MDLGLLAAESSRWSLALLPGFVPGARMLHRSAQVLPAFVGNTARSSAKARVASGIPARYSIVPASLGIWAFR